MLRVEIKIEGLKNSGDSLKNSVSGVCLQCNSLTNVPYMLLVAV